MSRIEISKHELRLLEQILSMREMSLVQTLPRILERYYDAKDIHATKDYIYVVGDLPIALIAHLDTVHPTPPATIYHDPRKGVLWSPNGLGADDRAGVFSIISIIDDGYRPSVIFTTKEETGGGGAFALIKDYQDPIAPLNFLVELDRQGKDDAVFYDCGNPDFERFITKFGFAKDWGSFSDIAIIGFEWDIAAVNLSIGYYDEHTLIERLNYREMFSTINRTKLILENCHTSPFDYQALLYQGFDYPVDGINFASANTCECCYKPYPRASLTPVYDDIDKEIWELCPECVAKYADPCEKCGTLLLNPRHQDKHIICSDCKTTEELTHDRQNIAQ